MAWLFDAACESSGDSEVYIVQESIDTGRLTSKLAHADTELSVLKTIQTNGRGTNTNNFDLNLSQMSIEHL